MTSEIALRRANPAKDRQHPHTFSNRHIKIGAIDRVDNECGGSEGCQSHLEYEA